MPYVNPDCTVMGKCLESCYVAPNSCQTSSNLRLKARLAGESAITSNLVSTSGNRMWHRIEGKERTSHGRVCSLSLPTAVVVPPAEWGICPFSWAPTDHPRLQSLLLCLSSFFARGFYLQCCLRGKFPAFDTAHSWCKFHSRNLGKWLWPLRTLFICKMAVIIPKSSS